MPVTANSAPHFDSNRAVWIGVAFSFAFVGLIWLTGELWLDPPPFAPRQDAAWFPVLWYHWQLAEPTFWTRATAWGGYILHQVIIWSLIWRAYRQGLKYTSGLHRVNIAALITNAVFIINASGAGRRMVLSVRKAGLKNLPVALMAAFTVLG